MRLDVKPDSWEDRIMLFTGYLIENQKQSSTVWSYISAIKAILQADGKEIHKNRVLLASITWACRINNDRV